ncbi:MAG: class I SAM-dependent methyltransferase [Acidimicrobiia bacterium]|jgi:SAM-dependent methyltransferase
MSDSGRAVIFGDDAVTYDRHRPTYPPEAIARIFSLVSVAKALEIGAGTGLATKDIARDGLELVCLEPSQDMAEVLRARNLPGIEVVESSFEDWAGPKDSFDLLYAAQAWHWVDPASGYEKAHGHLRPGGVLALMWNIPDDRYAPFEDVYADHAPQLLAEQDERIKRRDSHDWSADLVTSGFEDVDVFSHRWSATLEAAELRALYSTYSDHMMLPEPGRSELLSALEAKVERMGGSVSLRYHTDVFSGRA